MRARAIPDAGWSAGPGELGPRTVVDQAPGAAVLGDPPHPEGDPLGRHRHDLHIDTTSMMLMEVRSSVAPAEGGKNVAGASVLPE